MRRARQGPVHRHFADKEELLSVVAAGYFVRVGEEMAGAADAAGDAHGRLEAMAGRTCASPWRTRTGAG